MHYNVSSFDSAAQQVALAAQQCLGRLQAKRQLDEAAQDDVAAARSMLEALPLATDEFALACRRLQNAQHYLRYAEPGAAWYELRLLSGSLAHDHHPVREPVRRLRRRT